MASKVEKKYYLNILLGIMGLVCLATGIIRDTRPQVVYQISEILWVLKNLHLWTGYLCTILLIIHLLWNWEWIQAMTKNIGKVRGKMWMAIACVVAGIIFCVGVATLVPAKKSQHTSEKITMQNTDNTSEATKIVGKS